MENNGLVRLQEHWARSENSKVHSAVKVFCSSSDEGIVSVQSEWKAMSDPGRLNYIIMGNHIQSRHLRNMLLSARDVCGVAVTTTDQILFVFSKSVPLSRLYVRFGQSECSSWIRDTISSISDSVPGISTQETQTDIIATCTSVVPINLSALLERVWNNKSITTIRIEGRANVHIPESIDIDDLLKDDNVEVVRETTALWSKVTTWCQKRVTMSITDGILTKDSARAVATVCIIGTAFIAGILIDRMVER